MTWIAPAMFGLVAVAALGSAAFMGVVNLRDGYGPWWPVVGNATVGLLFVAITLAKIMVPVTP